MGGSMRLQLLFMEAVATHGNGWRVRTRMSSPAVTGRVISQLLSAPFPLSPPLLYIVGLDP